MDRLAEVRSGSKTGETRKQRTRAALRAALLHLLADKEFDQILISDITRQAKVGYATFFRHYSAKEDVLSEIAAEEIAGLLGMSIPVMQASDSANSCIALCRYVDDRRSLWRTLLAGGAAASVRKEFVRQALEWLEDNSPPRNTVPIELGTVCSAGSTIDALAWWLDRGDKYSVEEIADFINRLIIAPFVPPQE